LGKDLHPGSSAVLLVKVDGIIPKARLTTHTKGNTKKLSSSLEVGGAPNGRRPVRGDLSLAREVRCERAFKEERGGHHSV